MMARRAALLLSACFALWALFAIWIAPLLISMAHQGTLPLSDALLAARARVPLSYYLEQWQVMTTWMTALFGTAVIIGVERRWIHKPSLSVAVIVVGGWLFHMATLRNGISYGSDGALYLLHARNIVEGLPYGATGYIQNPTHFHSPPSYPPLLPVLLAPIYALTQLNLWPMKVLLVTITAGATAAIYGLSRKFLPPGVSLLAAWLFVFSPFVRWLKQDILADLPFLAIVIACLMVAERSADADPREDAGWKRGVAVGLLAYLAVATRAIGVVLIPAVLIADFMRMRRVSRYAGAVAVVAAALVGLQEIVLGSVGGYTARLTAYSPGQFLLGMISRADAYAGRLSNMMFGTLPPIIQYTLWALIAALAAVGIFWLAWRRTSPTAVFFLVYTAVVLAWPDNSGSGPRVFLPLAVLLPVMAFAGLQKIEVLASIRMPVVAAVAVLSAVSFALGHRTAERGDLRHDYRAREHVEMAAFVQKETIPTDVIVSIAPRTIALLTRRPSTIYDFHLSFERQWEYMDRVGARYVLWFLPASAGFRDARDAEYMRDFVAASTPSLEPVFSNRMYRIYRIMQAVVADSDSVAIRPTPPSPVP